MFAVVVGVAAGVVVGDGGGPWTLITVVSIFVTVLVVKVFHSVWAAAVWTLVMTIGAA